MSDDRLPSKSDHLAGPALRVIVWIGSHDDAPPIDGVRIAVVNPDDTSATAVIDALRDSGLTAADLKVRAVVMVSPSVKPVRAVATYAAVCVLAGRRLDASVGERVVELSNLDRLLRAAPTPPRPDEPPVCVQVGAPHPQMYATALDGGSLTPQALVAIRHARRVRLVVVDGTPIDDALTAFVAITALRVRAGQERFPLLVRGDEPADPDPLPDGTLPKGFDLDTVRAGASELKRSLRSDSVRILAEAVEPSPRLQSFAEASRLDVVGALTALGSVTPDGVLWHCPRPQRHSNGDANASMKVELNRARCFRCDAEFVDALRLVADARDLTADEAVAWLADHDIAPAG